MKMLLLLPLLLLSGCFYANERGVSTQQYHECKESYDAQGNYVKECPKNNLFEYEDLHQ